ncbi:MAG TPA: hypothetical protein VEZ55_02715 [Chitinophagaceae bacterium]|nr:hypothetical protein [Chitinophagaceae bacterium]
MEHLPLTVSSLFVATTLLTVFFLVKASGFSKKLMIVIAAWLALQAIISKTGFYLFTNSLPPRFLLAVVPAFIAIALLFLTPAGKRFVKSLNPKDLTLLHIVRIPVEICLFLLFLNKAVPAAMTFEGSNFDIVSGITAPLVYYFFFVKRNLPVKAVLMWNTACLLLLINIIVTASLAAPFPFQQLAFDQPNVAVLHFPFVWLPSFIVPAVLLAHLASIKHLLSNRSEKRVAADRHAKEHHSRSDRATTLV